MKRSLGMKLWVGLIDAATQGSVVGQLATARRLHPGFRLSWPLIWHVAGALRGGLSLAAGRYDSAVTPVSRKLSRGACPLVWVIAWRPF